MRLFNFTITEGRTTVADLTATSPTSNLVVSGVNGAGVAALDRQSSNLYALQPTRAMIQMKTHTEMCNCTTLE